jgi:hypothetical protein
MEILAMSEALAEALASYTYSITQLSKQGAL